MIMPTRAEDFREGLRWCAEIYHTLGRQLKKKVIPRQWGTKAACTEPRFG
ncbi:MAG: hypothetical protein ACLSHA_09565 [Neglectibacter timonensis]